MSKIGVCRECQQREVGCHSRCEKYIKEIEEHRKEVEREKRIKDRERPFYDRLRQQKTHNLRYRQNRGDR